MKNDIPVTMEHGMSACFALSPGGYAFEWPMRIGITGATGFIGTALAKAAAKRGHELVAYTRGNKRSLPGFSEVRPFSPDNEQVLDPSGLDALVHLAGENVFGLWTKAKKKRIYDSRVPVTQRIVECLQVAQSPPGVFVCASGTGAYGDAGDQVLTESAPRGRDFLAEVCEGWETAASRAHALGIRVVLLRTGMVLGQKGGAWPMLRRIFSARLGSRLGDGTQWIPWIHLDDEIGIILAALEKPAYQGPVNLCAPNPVTNAQLTHEIAAALKTSTFIPAPAFALRLMLRDAAAMVLGSQRCMPKVAQDLGYQFRYTELPDALAALV